VSEFFRTKEWLTIAQLTGAWSSELAKGGEDPKQCEQNLVHILLEDIINGRLDDSGPPRDNGQRLGLRLITPEYKPGFIEGPQLLECIQNDPSRVLHNVVIMKEAVLDFAKRRELAHLHGGSIPPARPPPRSRTTRRSISSNPISELQLPDLWASNRAS
jgi:hypothetical protein